MIIPQTMNTTTYHREDDQDEEDGWIEVFIV